MTELDADLRRPPLHGYRVLCVGDGTAEAYCCRLLSDGGAEVILLEPPGGMSLRNWSASGVRRDGEDGALFQYLAAGAHSVVIEQESSSDRERLLQLVAGSDAVLWSPSSSFSTLLTPLGVRESNPAATVLTVTPFGLTGPWTDRAATDLTLQALSGGLGMRGSAEAPPVYVGGRFSEWLGGLEAAKMLLASRWRTRRTGVGELVDLSMLEAVLLQTVMHPVTFLDVAGQPFRASRMANLPDVHRARDGYVGFMVVTGQQWLDFCTMIGRPDWEEDESLIRMAARAQRRAELTTAIDDWMAERTTEEIVEFANLLRIPAAPLGNGKAVTGFDHLSERAAFVTNARGGFRQPGTAWIWHGADLSTPPLPAPRLGECAAEDRDGPQQSSAVEPADAGLPFEGLRIADFTANWAGPVVGHMMAMLGADCIHVESAQRPDAMRFNTARELHDPQWWEWAGLFQGTNTNKRDLTLDLASEQGRDLARRLIAGCDVVLENYSPRVMEGFGLGWEQVREINPRAVYVRMPAYGLTGPWRDRPGYAQTMELVSGLAWRTGHPDAAPVIPNGPCDPIAGGHATVALLLALEHQRATGTGLLVEVPMLGGALAVAAEQVIEYTAYGNLLERLGNRAEHMAPQGVYRSSDSSETWVAISVATDEHWRVLRKALGDPSWAQDPALDTVAGRWAAHDLLDRELATWVASRSAAATVAILSAGNVPVAPVTAPHETANHEQLLARGFIETVEHPVVGRGRYFGLPARFSAGPARVQRRGSPTLGEHNREILRDELSVSEADYEALQRQGVIGTSAGPSGLAW